jgi:hypothetical protein
MKKIKAQQVIVSEELKQKPYDANYLSGFVCCPGRWQPIFEVLSKLEPEQIPQFKADLLKASGLSSLHTDLEAAIDSKL